MLRVTHLSAVGSLREWIQDAIVSGQTHFALDLETTGLTRTDTIISAGLSGKTDEDVCLFGTELLPELLSFPEHATLVFHNAPFDLKHLAWAGVDVSTCCEYQDTLILAHLLDENGRHGLGALVENYFADNYKAEFWRRFKKAQDADRDSLAEYNARDVSYTLRLYKLLSEKLEQDGIPQSLIRHVHALQSAFLDTEVQGIAIDQSYLIDKGIALKTKIDTALPEMQALVSTAILEVECENWVKELEKRKTPKGRSNVPRPKFNWRSQHDLQNLIYKRLRLSLQTKYSFSERKHVPTLEYDALKLIEHEHPLIPLLLDYRDNDKVYGSFIEGTLSQMVNGRIFPSFSVTGTKTGRLSHQNPNLSQLPKTGGIKGIYVPDPGYCFVGADYDSLEVYIEAHFTQDPSLLSIINDGVSKHDITAKALKIDRSLAKTVNFAHQYWCTPKKTAQILGCSAAQGVALHKKYWQTYSGCMELKAKTDVMVDNGESVVNYMGRKRRFEKKRRTVFDEAYRQAYNARIQGTGSDLTSWSAYTCHAEFKKRGWGRLLFTKHDEVITIVKNEYADDACARLEEIMVAAGVHAGLSVKLKANSYIMRERWEDA